MVDVKKFSETDLYGLFEVQIEATEAEIRKAYRKKALSCHPDKNPDNPKAAELFQELSKALEILLDTAARSAYDRMLNAKKQAELRNKQLDSKRQKFKSDLEERERKAQDDLMKRYNCSTKAKTPEEIFKDEFERLRKEGNKLVEEEQESLRQQLREETRVQQQKAPSWDSAKYRIKIKWKVKKDDSNNGGYTEEHLRKYLQKYGDIIVLVMSPKNHGSALVEFKTQSGAEMAMEYEKGNPENPITLKWIGDAPENKNRRVPAGSSTVTDRDYESLVLRQMRQAQERKKLIEEMMKDDS